MGRWGWLWLAGWFAFSSAWCIGAGRELGPTYDEPFYVAAGLKAWHTGKAKDLAAAGTMPLPPMVATIPLLPLELVEHRPIDWSADFSGCVPTARLGTLPFWFLLLISGYIGGRIWAGEVAGLLAVAFLAVEPILLGHASLATTDLPFTACLVFLVVAFKAGRDGPWCRRVLIPTILCGLTLLSKASAVVFIPVCLVAAICERRDWRDGFIDLGQILAGGAGLARLVFPRTLDTLMFQVRHNAEGHGQIYLLGEVSPTGFWYYFPATVVIKTSLALLLMLALCLVRPRYLWNAPILAALGLIFISPTFHVQIGVRFLLPAVALAILGLAIALARWLAECRSLAGRRLIWGIATLALLWTGGQALLVWPQGICYTNELFGGTSRGYLALSDSNYDWGQGLPELRRWQRQHGPAALDVWYFGTDQRVEETPFRSVDPSTATSIADLRRSHRGRYLAASTSLLYGTAFSTPAARILRNLTPVGRTTTFLIYDFTDAPDESAVGSGESPAP